MKSIRIVAVVAALVVLSGCVDVIQYVSGAGSDIDVYLRLTLQKSAFDLGNAFSDEPQDMEEMFESEFELDEDTVTEELPPGISAEFAQVNDEFEYGFELSYTADREALLALDESGDGFFVPRIRNFGLSIPLGPTDGGNESGEGDEFAAAFLGGAKYRLFISKMLVSRVSQAYLVTPGDRVEVAVLELPDVWMVQFPVSLWLTSSEAPTLEVIF